MNQTAKTFAIVLIATLVVAIGYFWYVGGKKTPTSSSAVGKQATSTLTTTTGTSTNLAERQVILNIDDVIRNAIQKQGQTLPNVTVKPITDKYAVANLNSINDESEAGLKTYGKNIATALKPFSQERENEALVTLRVLDNKNIAELAKLRSSITLFSTAEKELAKMPVPKSAREYHLALLNSVSRVLTALIGMSEVLNNPELGLQSAGEYQKASPVFYSAIAEMNKYFTNRGVTWSDEEAIRIYVNLAE